MKHVVRRVLVSEYKKYREHLFKLSPEARQLRFGFDIKDETLSKLCDSFEKEPDKHVLFCVEDDMLNFIGVGHIALFETMELAFSVLDSHQNQGIGNKLMKRCIRYCRTRNVLNGNMVCLTRNSAIRKLCVKNRIKLQNDMGETQGDIQLPEPSINTFLNETIATNMGMFDYLNKRIKMPWILAFDLIKKETK